MSRRNPEKKTSSKKQKVAQTAIATASYSGPIPPPNLLKQYDEISPGLADRIVKMAETEMTHRQQVENKAIEADIKFASRDYDERRIGQILGFLIGVIALISGAYTATHGQPWAGGAIGTGGVVGLVTAFIYGRRSSSEEKNNNTE